ncbi:MAG: nitronate monooxygenase [Bifidobacteriaceae bacterium]|nr:nitronate monooxygenase [Bifidobacteriaceae bacterium]
MGNDSFMGRPAPVIGAPMAGGPSTPELTAAVTNAGGLGFLAAGYLTAQALMESMRRTRELTQGPFGVNLFVPEGPEHLAGGARSLEDSDLGRWFEYREFLSPFAQGLGVALPGEPEWSDDDYGAKIELLAADPPAVVSFTFGPPAPAVVERFQGLGTLVVANVASADDAAQAVALGVDALCVQGPEAGGHRATYGAAAEPPDMPLVELIEATAEAAGPPVIAAGGIATAELAAVCLGAGAVAVQVGTAFLGALEAGTRTAHLAAIVSGAYVQTEVTRAFSGRPARALATEFTAAARQLSPALYPELHFLTAPLRSAAAALNPSLLHLWAGTGFQAVRRAPAAQIVEALTPR